MGLKEEFQAFVDDQKRLFDKWFGAKEPEKASDIVPIVIALSMFVIIVLLLVFGYGE